MLVSLKKANRWPITRLLILMTIFCFILSIFRYYITETKVFLFLNWNLFLAGIPWVISTLIIIRGLQNKKRVLFILIPVWIIFFPNSPYILTDLFHLKPRNSAPVWYDLIVVLSYAWTGLVFGMSSLLDIEKMLENILSKKIIPFLASAFLFLSAFGIYLGRYLRWNSWDIIGDPGGLFGDIWDRISSPGTYPGAWGMTILFGIFLNIIYLTMKTISDQKRNAV